MRVEQPPVMLYTNFHYYEDLASGATYTPPARMIATACNEYTAWTGELYLEYWNGVAWRGGGGSYPAAPLLHQDDGQNIRVEIFGVAAYKISFAGVLGSGAKDYHYFEDLASGASYTPSTKAIATFLCEEGLIVSSRVHLDFFDGVGWVVAHGGLSEEFTIPVYQDNDQNIRVTNSHTVAREISLTGITWA